MKSDHKFRKRIKVDNDNNFYIKYLFYRSMNGLHITGMKLASPVPTKKVNTTTQIKPKETLINKSTAVKRSGAPVNPPTRLRSPVATKK